MKITELAVKRPVTTIMFFVGLIIMGAISIYRTPRELLPSMSYPQVTVVTRYEQASPAEIERQVTRVLEEAVGTVGRIRHLSSISREGLSLIMAEFMWGTDMNVASMDVREKIDLVKERLPREAREPIVIRFNPFELPVLTLTMSRTDHRTDAESLYKMKETADEIIKGNLEKIEGVAAVEVKGGREREILVEVDQRRIQAADISLLEIIHVIQNANLTYPAGTIDHGFFEYLVKTDGEYRDLNDIRSTPLKVQHFMEEERARYQREREAPKGLLLLSDVATVEDTFKERRGMLRYNGREAIAIDIKRQSGSNVVRVVRDIRRELAQIEDQIPDDYRLEIVYDQSEYVENSIRGIGSSAVVGSVLAFMVLFFFLRSLKSSAIVATAIPVSLAVTFIFIYFNDISLNMMSLGGLALGVGMLVDSSIVVLENIFRYNQENPGRGPLNAISGTQDVTGAIMSSTLTTITVFFPFVFIAGVAGQLFKELAFTVTFSLIASLLVAVTLIPRMSSRVVVKENTEPPWSLKLRNIYSGWLKGFLLNSKGYFILVGAVFLLSMVYIIRFSGQEFIPRVGANQFIMNLELPYGTRLERTEQVVSRIEEILNDIDEVTSITAGIGAAEAGAGTAEAYSLMGTHEAEITVGISVRSVRHMDNILGRIRSRVDREVSDAEVEYVTQASVIGGALASDAPITVDVRGQDIDGIVSASNELVEALERIPFIYGVRSSFRGYRPEFRVVVNRDRASLYNISAQNITLTAQTALQGYVPTSLRQEDEEVDIRVRLADPERSLSSRSGGGGTRSLAAGNPSRGSIDTDRIGRILIRSPLDHDILLNQVASFEEDAVSPEIMRKEGERTVSVTASYSDVSFARAIRAVEGAVERIQRQHSGFVIDITGDRQQMQESFQSLVFVIILSILFVYMIMASQFESLWQPFIVIFTLPLSFIGVAFILLVTGTQLSVIVLLGIIMLGGIVVNNGIVLISHYNLVEQSSIMTLDTIIDASVTRLRPVLMTAVTTILGLIPMAVAGGEGSEFRAPLAITVIGGLLVSTFLTLFVVPAVYHYGRRYITKTQNFLKNAGW